MFLMNTKPSMTCWGVPLGGVLSSMVRKYLSSGGKVSELLFGYIKIKHIRKEKTKHT
jgi:hypothetical protein